MDQRPLGSIKLSANRQDLIQPVSLFAGRLPVVLSGSKAPAPILPLQMIRSRAGRTRPPMSGQGASDGVVSLRARMACGHRRVRPGLVRTGPPAGRDGGAVRAGRVGPA